MTPCSAIHALCRVTLSILRKDLLYENSCFLLNPTKMFLNAEALGRHRRVRVLPRLFAPSARPTSLEY